MLQRGRRSANVVAPGAIDTPPRLTAPSTLTEAEKTLFNELVGSCHPEHFVESDLPLLVAFVQSTLLVRLTVPTLGKTNPETVAIWEKAVRVMAMLATRLRLAPQSRLDSKTVGVRQRNARVPPPSMGEGYG